MLNEERFAQATDELLRGEDIDGSEAMPISAELSLARRLRASASGGIPDPAFVLGLRDELRLTAKVRQRQSAVSVRYAALETPLGLLAFAYRNGSVVYCASLDAQGHVGASGDTTRRVQSAMEAFARDTARELGVWPERDDRLPLLLERAILRQFSGRGRAPVDVSYLPQFRRRVLEKTAEIPRGEVRPYGWIAREIGAPGATRAVGTALGHNPIPFLIPCHRVVRSDGSLGEYSGGGPAVKERVLAFEGAPVADLVQSAKSGRRFVGSDTTGIFCYPSCHAARRIHDEHLVAFANMDEARDAGFRACTLCRPA
jgi:O-6-methylguanine DNA methyltransferase